MVTETSSLSRIADKTGIPEHRLAEIVINPEVATTEDRIALASVVETNPESMSLTIEFPPGHNAP